MLSARDLVRQIPAEWQENVKHRRTSGLPPASSTKITDPARADGELASWFWGVQEVPDILDRWGGDAAARARAPGHRARGPGRRATCCGSASRRSSGLDPDGARRPTPTAANPSLGRPRDGAACAGSTQRVNDGVLVNEDYRQLVRELLAHRTLSQRVRLAAAGAAAATCAPGPSSCPSAWIDGARRRGGTTSSAPSTSCAPTRRDGATFVDPDRARRGRGRRRRACDASSRCSRRARRLRSRGAAAARRASTRPTAELDARPRACWFRDQARGSCTPRTTTGRRGRRSRSTAGCAGAEPLERRAGQQLAVGVPADLPGGVGVRAPRRPPRRPPAPGGPRCSAIALAGHPVTSSEVTSAAISVSRSGSCVGAVAMRHRRARAASSA